MNPIQSAIRNATAEIALDALLEALRRDEVYVEFNANPEQQCVEVTLSYGYQGSSHYRHSLTQEVI